MKKGVLMRWKIRNSCLNFLIRSSFSFFFWPSFDVLIFDLIRNMPNAFDSLWIYFERLVGCSYFIFIRNDLRRLHSSSSGKSVLIG